MMTEALKRAYYEWAMNNARIPTRESDNVMEGIAHELEKAGFALAPKDWDDRQ
jgi:hypothetical protein